MPPSTDALRLAFASTIGSSLPTTARRLRAYIAVRAITYISRKRDNGQSAGRSAGDGRAQFHLGSAMTDEQYQWDSPAIDRQSIALVLIVVVLALVLGTAAMWIGLR